MELGYKVHYHLEKVTWKKLGENSQTTDILFGAPCSIHSHTFNFSVDLKSRKVICLCVLKTTPGDF